MLLKYWWITWLQLLETICPQKHNWLGKISLEFLLKLLQWNKIASKRKNINFISSFYDQNSAHVVSRILEQQFGSQLNFCAEFLSHFQIGKVKDKAVFLVKGQAEKQTHNMTFLSKITDYCVFFFHFLSSALLLICTMKYIKSLH